jgi:hypothetical protein
MALTKQVIISEITFNEWGVLHVQTTTRALDDDGTEIGKRYSRTTVPPTTAIADVPTQRLKQHCQIEWTPAVIAAYRAKFPPLTAEG